MKKHTYRSCAVNFPVFSNYEMRVSVTSDFRKALNANPQTKKVETDDSDMAFCVHIADQAVTYIFLKPDADLGTIAHECWHAVREMMKFVGADDNETVAYHLGYLVKKVHKLVHRRKK